VTLSGTASIPTREYDMKGTASLATAGSAASEFDLPFVVQGPWDDPLVFPDPESLIRRSPGAAPLLEAVKDKNLRTLIERFTGGLPKLPAPDAEQPADTKAPSDTGGTKPN
jgi:AsmA protein